MTFTRVFSRYFNIKYFASGLIDLKFKKASWFCGFRPKLEYQVFKFLRVTDKVRFP